MPGETEQTVVHDALELHADDSSDEENTYKPVRNADVEAFVIKHPNHDRVSSVVSFVLEDEGRRVLYSDKVNELYHSKKREHLKHQSPIEEITPRQLITAINETLSVWGTQLPDEMDEEYFSHISVRKIFKQLNSEVVPEFLESTISSLTDDAYEVQSTEEGMRRLTMSEEADFVLTVQKIMEIGELKGYLLKAVEANLKSVKERYNNECENMFPAPISIGRIPAPLPSKEKRMDTFLENSYGVKCSKAIREYVMDPIKGKVHGGALGPLTESILQNEVTRYLEGGHIDQLRQGYNLQNSRLIGIAINRAEEKSYRTVTKCTKAERDSHLATVVQPNREEIRKETEERFSASLACNLQAAMQAPLVRKTLKTSYSDTSEIEDTASFYAKEHLLYRSAIRLARNNVSKKIARTIVFDDDADLISQKTQEVRSQKSEQNESGYVKHRGTMQEEVFNLGNYEKVLEKINSLNMQGSDFGPATIIRNVYKYGAKGFEKEDVLIDGKLPSEALNQKQKQVVVDLVELFFGTEAFRSPSTIPEVNMALDLIIGKKLTWQGLLTGQENGGLLSFTMKQEKGAGGVECGRRLSENVNKHHTRKHKYGGKPIAANSEGYGDYVTRKNSIASTWAREVLERNDELTPVSFREMVRSKEQQWYNGIFQ